MCLGVDGQRLSGSAGPSFRRASATDGVPEEATSQHRREAASPWDAGSRRARAGPNFLTSSSDATKATDAAAAVGGWEEQMTASVSDVDAKDMSVEVRHERREVAARSTLVVRIPRYYAEIPFLRSLLPVMGETSYQCTSLYSL